MKLFLIIGLLTVFSGAFAWFQNTRSVADVPQIQQNERVANFLAADKQTVLVELFTSQGCSTCPPADKVLSLLNKNQPIAEADIITLSLHVDYWDSPGWKDEFSSVMFSKRQDIYSTRFRGENYTPQMVVDGQTAFIGSHLDKAQKAISEATKTPKAKIELIQNQDKLKIKITDAPAHENATIFLAIAEDDLASGVRGGENSGRKLAHTSVVRELKSLGLLTAEQTNLEMETAIQLQPNWKKENLSLVVFLQENQKRKIFGAVKIKAE
ncbi:MAG: DUF1223 domain-containing protein [Acidobacteriota bacterium]|nr:DUF1223 domain-containing protein [Acidobacteriota bacterium]